MRYIQFNCFKYVFLDIYHQTPPLDTIKNHIMNRTNQTMNQITDCVAAFKIFEHIWREDRSESNDKKASESQWLKDQVNCYNSLLLQYVHLILVIFIDPHLGANYFPNPKTGRRSDHNQ